MLSSASLRSVLAGLVLLVAASPGRAATKEAAKPSPKEAEVRRLLQVLDTVQIARQVMAQVVEQFRKSLPAVPERFWTEFLRDADVHGLVDLIVPIYAEELALEDIRALTAFFESPAGQRYVKALPAITRKAQSAGTTWGTAIAGKIVRRLETEGYK